MSGISKLTQTVVINLNHVVLAERLGDKVVIQMTGGRVFQAYDPDGETWSSLLAKTADRDLSGPEWCEVDGR